MVKFLNSPERPKQGELSSFIHLLLHPPTVWALDLPTIHPVKVTKGLVCISNLCTYDLYSPVHTVLNACISITWGSGRGLGPGILKYGAV